MLAPVFSRAFPAVFDLSGAAADTLDDYVDQFTQWLWSYGSDTVQDYGATEVLDNTGTKTSGRVVQPGRVYTFDGTTADRLEIVTASVGTLYVSAIDDGAVAANVSIAYDTDRYKITVSAAQSIYHIKVWTDNTATDEQKLAESGTPPANMWAWLKADESAGTTAYDSSGNGRDFSVVTGDIAAFHSTTTTQYGSDYPNQVGYSDGAGGVLVPRDESNTTNDVLGNPLDYSGRVAYDAALVGSGCGDFDGVGDYVDCGDIGDFSTSDAFTISAWFISSSFVSTQGLVSKSDAAALGQYYILVSSGNLFFRVVRDGEYDGVALTGSPYSDGEAHHVVWTWASGVHKVYMDGVDVTGSLNPSSTGTVTDLLADSTPFEIGRRQTSGNFWSGQAWDVRIWSAELSAAEALSVYQGDDVQTANLVGHWPIAERSGPTIHDVSGNGLDGYLTTSDEAAFWGQTQDEYHYNYRYGFRKSGSVFIPALLDGSAAADGNPITNPIADTGAWHNDAETAVQQPVCPELIEVDVDHDFWYTAGVPNNVVHSDMDEFAPDGFDHLFTHEIVADNSEAP